MKTFHIFIPLLMHTPLTDSNGNDFEVIIADAAGNLITVLIFPTGEESFNVDIINQLQQHSASTSTKTYAYYFDVLYNSSINPWSIPEWAKVSADHAADIDFLFGDMTGLTDTQEWRGML